MQKKGMRLPSLVLIDPVTILSIEADDSLPVPVFPLAHVITVKTPLDMVPVRAEQLSHEFAPVRSQREVLAQTLMKLALIDAWPERGIDLARAAQAFVAPR
jgi:hypothetical protein